MNRLFDLVDVVGRVLLAALFIQDGWTVILNYASTTDYIAQHGIPATLLPLALATQIGGGVLIILGLWTRVAAVALGLFCLSTAVIFHAFSADFNEQIHFWKDLALAGGFFVLMANGARAYSLDALASRRAVAR
ncbi:MAG: DoxX family protein [Alphaproteobacteria bacterium]|nr:DoxX family protein [Alphaproteobacteria bacterium]